MKNGETRENICNVYHGQRVNIFNIHLVFTEREKKSI